MARKCKWGKLKNPVGKRVCKKKPRGKKKAAKRKPAKKKAAKKRGKKKTTVKICESWTGKRLPKCMHRSVCRGAKGRFAKKPC
jgi:hypothetical protein